MSNGYNVFHKRFEREDPRLGRHVRHDSRSLQYLVKAEDPATLKSVRHERHIPTMDQGNLGSCTGNAMVGCLGTGVYWNTGAVKQVLSATDVVVDEKYSVKVYSEATVWDPFPGSYPPTDTGSDGLSVAKIAKKWGLISGYLHATSLEAALTALAQRPLIMGSKWLGGMFNPKSDGRLVLSGSAAGGHEYILEELDVERQRVWIHNSWGPKWGINGRAYLTWQDLGHLLADRGDVTSFVPITEPAPIPTPPPAPPAPTTDPKAEFIASTRAWQGSFSKFLDWYEKQP